jgi:hypothetical protein
MSGFKLHQDKLLLILQNDWRSKIIQIFAEHWHEWNASTLWNKCYGRFDPDCEPYMTMLLQQSDCSFHMCLIEVFKLKPELKSGTLQYYDNELGWLRGRRFPSGSRYFCESLFWASQPKQAAKT